MDTWVASAFLAIVNSSAQTRPQDHASAASGCIYCDSFKNQNCGQIAAMSATSKFRIADFAFCVALLWLCMAVAGSHGDPHCTQEKTEDGGRARFLGPGELAPAGAEMRTAAAGFPPDPQGPFPVPTWPLPNKLGGDQETRHPLCG